MASSNVDDAVRNTVPNVNASARQMSRFSFCVMPGSVETRGGSKGAAPSEISGPPVAPHLRKFSAKVIKLRIAKQR